MDVLDQLPSGLFTWPAARAAGIRRGQIDDLVARHELRRVLTNVYVRASTPDSLDLRAAAAALVISPNAVIRDRTAAWLWGVDALDVRELEILPPVEASCLPGTNRARRHGVDGGQRDLAPHDIVSVSGVRTTTPLRTALDLACHLPRGQALAALDAFMRVHGLTHTDMKRELVRFHGRRGVVQARRLVPLADPRAESPGESRTRMRILDRGLPPPELQWWVHVDGVPVFRLDMAYPRHRVAVEYDGREFHERADDRAHDRRRRAWLEAEGWTVVVVTKDDLGDEAVDAWTRAIRIGLRLPTV